MNHRNIEQRVINIFANQVGTSPENITLNSTSSSLSMDSLDDVEVIMTLEEEFEIEICDNDADKLTSVQKTIEFVSKELN